MAEYLDCIVASLRRHYAWTVSGWLKGRLKWPPKLPQTPGVTKTYLHHGTVGMFGGREMQEWVQKERKLAQETPVTNLRQRDAN